MELRLSCVLKIHWIAIIMLSQPLPHTLNCANITQVQTLTLPGGAMPLLKLTKKQVQENYERGVRHRTAERRTQLLNTNTQRNGTSRGPSGERTLWPCGERQQKSCNELVLCDYYPPCSHWITDTKSGAPKEGVACNKTHMKDDDIASTTAYGLASSYIHHPARFKTRTLLHITPLLTYIYI